MCDSPVPAEMESDGVMHPVDDVRNPLLKTGLAYWRSLCRDRRYPQRGDLTLRGMAAFLPYSVIIGVIDGGADYEYKLVGDAQRQAFKAHFKGLKVSQIEAAAPEFGATLRGAYEQVRSSGLPFVVRVRNNPDPFEPMPYFECMFLPLGADDVDHLLIVGIQIPEPFWKLPLDKIERLVDDARAPAAASQFVPPAASPIC